MHLGGGARISISLSSSKALCYFSQPSLQELKMSLLAPDAPALRIREKEQVRYFLDFQGLVHGQEQG